MYKQLFFIGIFMFALIGTGCATKNFIKPTAKEIDAYIAANPDLPELDKGCLLDGRFEIGMKASTVEFLLKKPELIEPIQQPWGKQEKWTYKSGRSKKIFFMEGGGVVGIQEE